MKVTTRITASQEQAPFLIQTTATKRMRIRGGINVNSTARLNLKSNQDDPNETRVVSSNTVDVGVIGNAAAVTREVGKEEESGEVEGVRALQGCGGMTDQGKKIKAEGDDTGEDGQGSEHKSNLGKPVEDREAEAEVKCSDAR